ncbi:hypothetical protein SAMN05421693_10190 [Ectothiorhodospira magna]|uniref:Uncharacterized protein n=1 Tax=Ectothiorhodospira magna TaxID=867345 RepID=A0A1H8Z1R3_9GAMM|nr:hypothetical protein [Ectothiorhodospira magna]SEP57538.1 hypothetical protein SAMN05421693_10190 [Ectothiorhodospira magna]
MPARTRMILIAAAAFVAIVFFQPLLTFLGGILVIAVAATLIFRDLPQDTQDMIEGHLNGWIRRARSGFWPAEDSASEHRGTSARARVIEAELDDEEEDDEAPAPKPKPRTRRPRTKKTTSASSGSSSSTSS